MERLALRKPVNLGINCLASRAVPTLKLMQGTYFQVVPFTLTGEKATSRRLWG